MAIKKKPLSLRAIVLSALYEMNLPYVDRNVVADRVAKRLGGHYVKTRAGWEKKAAPARRVVLGRGRLVKAENWAGVSQPEERSILCGRDLEPRHTISQQLQLLSCPDKYKGKQVRLVAEILP